MSNAITERQLALFRAVEDIHDLTNAITVVVVDASGEPVAASGDIDEIPAPMRAVLSGDKLAAAGSVRSLLGDLELPPNAPPVNLSLFDVGHRHVLAVLFDVEADLMNVQTIGKEAAAMISEILTTL